jgi:hypothetical protein
MGSTKNSRSKKQEDPMVHRINDVLINDDIFLTAEKTPPAAWSIIQHAVPKEPEDEAILAQGGTPLRHMAFSMLRQNVEVMHASAKSPIEKIFLGSLLIHCMARNPFSLQYIYPVKGNPEEHQANFRAEHEEVMRAWNLYQKDSGITEASDFLNFINWRTDKFNVP